MAAHYDAIVIGAGLGGLSAAATLARAGLGVRLFERHVQPGGYATTFVRDRHEFEVSLHALSGIGTPGNRGTLWPILEKLGVSDRVEFLPIESLYRSIAPGLDLRLPPGPEQAIDVLCSTFPDERRGLKRVIREILAIQREATQATSGGDPPSTFEALTRYPRLSHAAITPLSTLLDRELRGPLPKLAVAQLWGYFGLPPSKASLVYFAGGLASYLRFGASYPKGKSQALSNAFVDSIEAAGGRVSLGCGIKKILVRSGSIHGVITDHDETVTAAAVLSNASPLTTCVDLLDKGDVPEQYLRRIFAGRISLGSVCAYVGLDVEHTQLGLLDHEVFINDSADIDSHYEAYLGTGMPEAFLLACYNGTDPTFSPPGTSSVVLVSLASGDAWARVHPAEYPALKHQFAQHMIERANRVFPGLRDHVEVAVVSTPVTNMRYTANPGGAIYGFANTPAENPGWRPGYRGPLPGLWFAGAWTQPGGGYEPCIASGYLAARCILTERGANVQ
jgi:phytoene dehydrogenase-like protein